MEIRNRSNGELTTVSQFKATQPNTSFPKQITTDILDSYGYDPVLNGAAATVTAPYGVSTRSGVEEVKGQWFTKFIAGPVFTDTTDSEGKVTTAANNEAAYKAGVDATAAESVRTERNKLMHDTDWTQAADGKLSDSVKAAWVTYRQELRDLSAASGFPHTMTWPTKPS
jgi:hypothetical protein